MLTARLTKIENLPEGERKFVEDLLLDRPRPTAAVISARYAEKFGKHLAASTIHSHLQRRLEVQRKRTLELLAEKRATCQLIGTDGLDFAAQAQIWEAVQGMSAGQLILLRRVETKRKELELKEKAQATRNQELELKVKQFESQQVQAKEAIEETEQKVAGGRAVTREDIDRIRERVFGLPARGTQATGSEAAAGDSALPVPAKMGG
jgi:hypothetical protein